MRKDGAFTKKERLSMIARSIAKSMPQGISLEDVLDWVEYEIGLNRHTAERYVEIVTRRQGWDIVDGRITVEA